MAMPLANPAIMAEFAAAAFRVGDIVENFGQVGRVVGTKQDGSLVVRELSGRRGWIADPAKCKPVC